MGYEAHGLRTSGKIPEAIKAHGVDEIVVSDRWTVFRCLRVFSDSAVFLLKYLRCLFFRVFFIRIITDDALQNLWIAATMTLHRIIFKTRSKNQFVRSH